MGDERALLKRLRQREKNRLKKEAQKERDTQRAQVAAASLIPTLLYEEDVFALQQAIHQASALRGHVPVLDAEAAVAQERLAQLQLHAQAERKAAVIEEHLEHYEEVQLVAATDGKGPGSLKKAAGDGDDSNEEKCAICLDERNTHIIVPCGHQCLCKGCSGKISPGLCPVCRTEILSVMRVFK